MRPSLELNPIAISWEICYCCILAIAKMFFCSQCHMVVLV